MNADNPKGYENPDLLWTPAQLGERMGDPNLRIIDTRPGERFAMGHIPGARHFNVYAINCDDSDEAPLMSFLRMWAFLLGNRGVSFENAIVFYDDMVGNTCVRGFWFLELFGHGDVHVLDGGYGAWERAGLATTRDAEPPKAAEATSAVDPAAYDAIAKLSQEIIEKVVWEVVPDLAEKIIREELDRLVEKRR